MYLNDLTKTILLLRRRYHASVWRRNLIFIWVAQFCTWLKVCSYKVI